MRDCGLGIPKEDRARIFEPFVQGKSAEAGGIGLVSKEGGNGGGVLRIKTRVFSFARRFYKDTGDELESQTEKTASREVVFGSRFRLQRELWKSGRRQ